MDSASEGFVSWLENSLDTYKMYNIADDISSLKEGTIMVRKGAYSAGSIRVG